MTQKPKLEPNEILTIIALIDAEMKENVKYFNAGLLPSAVVLLSNFHLSVIRNKLVKREKRPNHKPNKNKTKKA